MMKFKKKLENKRKKKKKEELKVNLIKTIWTL